MPDNPEAKQLVNQALTLGTLGSYSFFVALTAAIIRLVRYEAIVRPR